MRPSPVGWKTWAMMVVLAVGTIGPRSLGQCEVAELIAPGGDVDNLFGGRVAIDGDVVLVGDGTAFESAGAAYVFRRVASEWIVVEDVLTSPNPAAQNGVPSDVAVWQDTALVGENTADLQGFNSGAVYVFRYDTVSSTWIHENTLLASDKDDNDLFGYSVAIDGAVAVIGAPQDENEGTPSSGSAYVFRFDDSVWIQEAKLTDPAGEEDDVFGASVSIKGNVALIGAFGSDHPDVGDGSAFVFRYDGMAWVLEAELTAFSSIGSNLEFGRAVSLANDVALVGAPQENGQLGAAYVFRYNGRRWISDARLVASNPVGPFPLFGSSVSISDGGNIAVIGALFDSELGFAAGATHVFRRDGEAWAEIVKLFASDGGSSENFGGSVAQDEDIAVVGGPGQGQDPGAAYILEGISGADCNSNAAPDACDIFSGASDDSNHDGIPDECSEVGDIDGNGAVDVVDLLSMLAVWGQCSQPCPPSCVGDVDGSCIVDSVDLLTLLINWSTSPTR